MFINKYIFGSLMTWRAILAVNTIALILILYTVKLSFDIASSTQIINIRIEEVSTIVIAWGVMLESRKTILANRNSVDRVNELLNEFCEHFGIHLVTLGLLLEVVTYFEEDARLESMPLWFHEAAYLLEWFIALCIVLELLDGCYSVIQIRRRNRIGI